MNWKWIVAVAAAGAIVATAEGVRDDATAGPGDAGAATGAAAELRADGAPDAESARDGSEAAAETERPASPTAAAALAADEAAIRETIQAYFDGIMNADAERLNRAFHGEAVLLAALPGRLYRSSYAEWKRFADGSRPPRDPATHTNRILSIDIAGNAAVVKTDLDWPDVHYVDYLSLLRTDGGDWKIVNKVWHEERR